MQFNNMKGNKSPESHFSDRAFTFTSSYQPLDSTQEENSKCRKNRSPTTPLNCMS